MVSLQENGETGHVHQTTETPSCQEAVTAGIGDYRRFLALAVRFITLAQSRPVIPIITPSAFLCGLGWNFSDT
jgi:hypothetical protein